MSVTALFMVLRWASLKEFLSHLGPFDGDEVRVSKLGIMCGSKRNDENGSSRQLEIDHEVRRTATLMELLGYQLLPASTLTDELSLRVLYGTALMSSLTNKF